MKGQVWEYIDDGRLYLVLDNDPDAASAHRTNMLNLQNGHVAYVSVNAFSSMPAAVKRWRRFA